VTVTTEVLILVAGLGLLIGLIVSRLSVRAASAQHRELQAREEAQQADAARTAHETRLARSLEFARTEDAALDTVSRALRELFPDRTTELLLADSSRAHLRQVITTDGNGVNGCTVGTPNDCPAVTRGHGLQFESSEGYDVCPHLRDRGIAACSAVCVPIAINGTATGVLHSIGPQHRHMDREAVGQLELIAGRAGDRIGVLRAFDRSEAQAATDPLTGLLNRRSFEEEVEALAMTGTRFAIAYGDLDQFKSINDRHGHPTGDRVLRVFSRAIRECLRPGDLAARWGGEEFVLAFPDTPLQGAIGALERIRESLCEIVDSGLVPHLTVSFGVCDWSSGADVATLIAVADECLLTAKRDGRDRIVTPQTHAKEARR
jgi:diguanylate cyclase (GGDEF)-like protein